MTKKSFTEHWMREREKERVKRKIDKLYKLCPLLDEYNQCETCIYFVRIPEFELTTVRYYCSKEHFARPISVKKFECNSWTKEQ